MYVATKIDQWTEDMRDFLQKGQHRLWVGGTDTGADINLFWEWAFWKVNTPMLRGVLIEFLLVKHLLDHANDVVGRRIRSLTRDIPDQEALRRSLEQFYVHQPAGDVFDLQLQWGVTVEIKSMTENDERALRSKSWWGSHSGLDKTQQVFAAQFYVVAVLPAHIDTKEDGVFVPDLKCYVLSGADLDRLAQGRESVPFRQWRDIAGAPCSYDEVYRRLYARQRTDLLAVKRKLFRKWRMPLPSRFGKPLVRRYPDPNPRTLVPLASYDGKDMDLAWWDMTARDTAGHFRLDSIPYPFKPDVADITWRDWESAGFRYDRKHPED